MSGRESLREQLLSAAREWADAESRAATAYEWGNRRESEVVEARAEFEALLDRVDELERKATQAEFMRATGLMVAPTRDEGEKNQ